MTDISPDPKVQPQAHAIAMADLIRVFGRIGVMSFGGPAAQIALMHKELVEDRPWLSEAGFLRALSFCMMLPGPEAMQLATYAGWRLRGAPGGVLAGLLFVLPGALVIAALVFLYMNFGTQPLVQAGFLGIKAAVVAIILQALQRLGKKALHGVTDLALAAFGFLALFLFALPFPLVLLTAALLGSLRMKSTENEPEAPPPAGAGPVWVTLLLWGGLWLLPLGALSLFGPQLLADIGWFFAKLAVVTFGGAYAVLAYMSQTVVAQYQWIETGQMIDALGLAETTPGPLILVTQFVAMLAGALASGTWMALAAGLVALWATFMPCFLWIFLAAPHVERIASHPRLGAALRAITAVVAGVILNLSVWFLLHVLFRETVTLELPAISLMLPVMASLDVSAALLVLAAPVVALACGGRLALILPIMAGLGIAMAQII
ncbi:chromate efflux transporter [Phaeobacter inhibens]|uniref:chromate efflux transporter n=1 Tax=Phaeobacter inhibens TaxID=221822 RepID=UPI0021A37BBF|nr:chromate efflux transporter [Phaeobacter inhibens]UWR89863.1 chromate efflux transporter [Phaeobacter inhibens]